MSDRELREARQLARTAEITRGEARESADFRHIRSPIAGTVSARNVRMGEVASAAVPAFQVVDLDRLIGEPFELRAGGILLARVEPVAHGDGIAVKLVEVPEDDDDTRG